MAGASLAYLLSVNCASVVLHCGTVGCKNSTHLDPAALARKVGVDTTLDQVERAARCDRCGVKGRCWSEPVIPMNPGAGGYGHER